MTFMTLELGYKVRRAKLDHCEGLRVFAHDLDSFCIPIEDADYLAKTYRRYLIANGIFNRLHGSLEKFEETETDIRLIVLWHRDKNIPQKPGEFHLLAAIEFVHYEALVPMALAIRWCMMMEFLIWQDQRLEEQEKDQENETPTVFIDEDDQISAT